MVSTYFILESSLACTGYSQNNVFYHSQQALNTFCLIFVPAHNQFFFSTNTGYLFQFLFYTILRNIKRDWFCLGYFDEYLVGWLPLGHAVSPKVRSVELLTIASAGAILVVQEDCRCRRWFSLSGLAVTAFVDGFSFCTEMCLCCPFPQLPPKCLCW